MGKPRSDSGHDLQPIPKSYPQPLFSPLLLPVPVVANPAERLAKITKPCLFHASELMKLINPLHGGLTPNAKPSKLAPRVFASKGQQAKRRE